MRCEHMRSRKIIKKFLQLTAILLLLVFAFPATAFLLLQSSRIQTRLANRIMLTVSENLNTKFTIGKIDIAFLYRIRLNDVYLEDLAGDTLLYVENMTTGIRYINPLAREVTISSINFDKALVGLAIDSAGNLNLQYFINKLQGDGKGEGGWEVKFNNLRLNDSRFYLRNYIRETVESGINFTNLRITGMDADIKRFKPSKDSLSFYIKSLRFNESSGFILSRLSGEFSQSKKFLSFRDVSLLTPDSHIEGDEITLRFYDWGKFKADSFVHHVRLRLMLSQSRVNLSDISYFAPALSNTNQVITFAGEVTGPVSNLKGKKLEIGFANNTVLKGELNLEGLPDIRETFIYANIKEFTTTSYDLKTLNLPGQHTLKIPEQLNKLGLISYQGKFTGFFNDFVAYGKFNSALGIINTDILFRPDTLNYIDFEGKFTAEDFDLGTLLDEGKNFGKISLSASVSGVSSAGRSIDATLKGVIQRFEFKQYEYTNIRLSGNLKNKTFNGSVNINDPNIELEFLGRVNLSDSIPEFDFTANVIEANLYALNLNKSDPDFTSTFYLIANARGNSINNLHGEVKLLNSLFTKKDQQLQIYDFSIVAGNRDGMNYLQLRSDVIDADLSGDYELSKGNESLQQLLYSYLPALVDTVITGQETLKNSINLTATIKNAKPLFDFFLPGYYLADKTELACTYKAGSKELMIRLNSPELTAGSITWNDIDLNVTGDGTSLDIEAGGKKLTLAGRINLENFTIFTNAGADTAGILVRWNNWQDDQYKGSLRAMAEIHRVSGKDQPYFDINLFPASIVANDTVWEVKPGKIRIDSTSTTIENLMVFHNSEFFRLNGVISEKPEDEMDLEFNRFNLGNLNGISLSSGFKLGGVLNGRASVSNVYKNVLFTSLLNIDSLIINDEVLGNTQIRSTWDDSRKAVDVNAHAMRDNLKTFEIQGEYKPAGQGKLDFNLSLDKLRLNLFNPYANSIFSDLRGLATGKATLSGTIKQPVLNGELNLQKTAFTVNYLKARYNFTEKILIENNNIYFKDIRIYDPKGNSAYLNGAIRNRYLKDFRFDLNIRSEDFLCMNTTQLDNKMFYGTAYATGVIKIFGPPKNMNIDIRATTSKNTSIKIPLSNEGELNKYNFITMTNDFADTEVEFKTRNYQVDLSGLQINMILEVTPDAEVQIIFDPKLGDIIKGRGNGNLDMKISTSGNFVMYGEYIIEEGDYLFTLQNFINKKFTIESGGKILWTGDPLDATIDIVANYRTRASLSDLLGTDDERSRTKILVDDRLTMTGKLMLPDVKYDIFLPSSDEATRLILSNAIHSSEDLNKQFISLLIQNRFVPYNPGGHSSGSSSGSGYSNAAGVNASEFLSNQLSNWLSQISNDVDVGVNYRSNREMKSDEVQVALSTQLFNDRLTINGSVDVATNAAAYASDNIVGEFDIDYKITKNGKFRIKTYNHANNDMLYENASYTQGLGVFYKEEFSTFGELMRRYWRAVFGVKEEEVAETAE